MRGAAGHAIGREGGRIVNECNEARLLTNLVEIMRRRRGLLNKNGWMSLCVCLCMRKRKDVWKQREDGCRKETRTEQKRRQVSSPSCFPLV